MNSRAISVVRSVLKESTTTISSAHATLSRQRRTLASSLPVMMQTERKGDAVPDGFSEGVDMAP